MKAEGDDPADLVSAYGLMAARFGAHVDLGRAALIVTSNRALEEWPTLFDDPLLAGAALDRLLHHAEFRVLEGHSYRDASRRRGKPSPWSVSA